MRQVNRDELRHVIASGLRRLSASQIKALQHHNSAEQLRAQLRAAEVIMRNLSHCEVLTDAPPPPPFRYPDLGDRPDAPMVEE